MKLSKAFLNEMRTGINSLIGHMARMNGKTSLLQYVDNLYGHIEALEQELIDIKPFEYVATATQIGTGILSERAGYPLKVQRCSKELWAVISGKYKGHVIHESNCKEIDFDEILQQNTELKQENLQRLEEVKVLQRQVDSLMELTGRKNSHIRGLNESLSEAWAAHNAEREARTLLEATLERAMLDHQPMVLPEEVDLAVKHYSRGGILHKNGIVHSILSESSAIAKLARQKLDEIGDDDLLFHALAFGYTVEEDKTPEDKVLNYYITITPKDWKFTGDGNDPVYIERNAIRTTCYLLGKTIDGLNSK